MDLGITLLTYWHCWEPQGEGFEVHGQGGEHRKAQTLAVMLASNTMKALVRPPVLHGQYRKLRALEA